MEIHQAKRVCGERYQTLRQIQDYILGDDVHYRVGETCQLHTTRAIMKFVVSLD